MRVMVLVAGVLFAGCAETRSYVMPVTSFEGRLMRPALVAAAQSQGLRAWDGYDGVMCRLEDETLLTWSESRRSFELSISLAPEATAAQFAQAKRRADELWMIAVQLRQTMAPPGVTYVVPHEERRRRRGPDQCRTSLECEWSEWCKDRGDGVRMCMGNGREGAFCSSSLDCGDGLWCRETRGSLSVCRR